MDITIEDILDEECNLVDSTTTGSQSVARVRNVKNRPSRIN